MPTSDLRLLTTTEAAALLRVHPKQVYRLLRRGLPGHRVGGDWRFREAELLAWATKDHGVRAPKTHDDDKSTSLASVDPSPAGLVAANGDVVIEILIELVNAAGPGLLGFVQADRARALALLESGSVLAAGCHGEGPPTRVGAARIARIHLVEREVGVASRNARAAPKPSQMDPKRFAGRPPSAGIVTHLRTALRKDGRDPAAFLAKMQRYDSHRDVVCAVARGEALAGLTTRAWAERVGLAFRKLAVEDYSVLVRGNDLGHPLVVHLCECVQGAAFRRAIRDVPGYDARGAGDIRYDPDPAGAATVATLQPATQRKGHR